MLVRFVGDVHGKWEQYRKVIAGTALSIQVGDMGIGFCNGTPAEGIPGDHWFIRGNHDNPKLSAITNGSFEDGEGFIFYDGKKMMCIGGALSIDRYYRIEGVSWWRDEEVSTAMFEQYIGEYGRWKPDIMVSHDCPQSIAQKFFLHGRNDFPSRTRLALQTMFEIHRPKLWVFGHWHERKDEVVSGTRFVCLEVLGTIDIETEGL